MRLPSLRSLIKVFQLPLPMLLLLSCSKGENTVSLPPPPPVLIQYWDLHDKEVSLESPKALDLDCDGIQDLYFTAVTLAPAPAAIELRFSVSSRVHAALLTNPQEQTPCLYRNEPVNTAAPAWHWQDTASAVMAIEVRGNTGGSNWIGNWSVASRRYLPYRLRRSGKEHYGWVEISLDRQKRSLVLHRAALTIESSKPIRAGQ
jgi:hypothetical protein